MLGTVIRAEEELRDLPIEPLWFGILTLAIFIALLVGLLMFVKGRPHTCVDCDRSPCPSRCRCDPRRHRPPAQSTRRHHGRHL